MIEDVIAYYAIGGVAVGLLGVLIDRALLVRLGGVALFLVGAAMVAHTAVWGADYGQPSWLGPVVAVGAILCGIIWMLPDPYGLQRQDKARRSKGLCCWCLRRRAVRWHRLNTSKPNHVEREGRCWLHWSRAPGPRSDLEAC